MIFLKKYTEIYFLQTFWKDGLSKKGRHMIFLILSGKMVFFPQNMIFFPWAESEWQLSQELHGNMTFFVYTYGCYKRGATPLCKEIKDGLIPQKYT